MRWKNNFLRYDIGVLKMKCKIHARANVNPTEDIDKVIRTLSNLFDYDDMEIGDDYVCILGDKDSISNLKNELRERKIRGAARKIMMKGIHEDKINFNLSKQAALVGIPNFVDNTLSPLGEIEVEIKIEDPMKFIDWIAPEIK